MSEWLARGKSPARDKAGLVDDTREKPYGVFYTRDNPLTAESRA